MFGREFMINTLRTDDADLRFYITTMKDGWRKSAFLTRACFPCTIHLIMQYTEPVSEWSFLDSGCTKTKFSPRIVVYGDTSVVPGSTYSSSSTTPLISSPKNLRSTLLFTKLSLKHCFRPNSQHDVTAAFNVISKCEANVPDITAYRGSRGKAPPNLYHATRWKWAATQADCMIPGEITSVPLKQDPELALESVWTLCRRDKHRVSAGKWTSDCPAHSTVTVWSDLSWFLQWIL